MSLRALRRVNQPLIFSALFSLVLASPALGAEPRTYANLGIQIQSGGQARYTFSLVTTGTPTDAQRRSLESLLGAPLKGGDDSDDDGNGDDDDDGSTQPAPKPSAQPGTTASTQAAPRPGSQQAGGASEPARAIFLTASWTKQVRLNGMAIEEQIDASGLLRAVTAVGANTLSIFISHPRTGFSGCTDQWPARANPFSSYSPTEFHHYILSEPADAGQPSFIRISYGYTNRMLATRAIAVGLFFLIPVFLVLWKRISVSRSEGENSAADRFAAVRLLNLISIGLPISWWVLRSLSGVDDVTSFIESGYSPGLRTALETAVYIVPPLVFILICAVILNPLLKRPDGGGTVKVGNLRRTGYQVLGVYLPLLLTLASLAELIRGEFSVGIGYMVASQLLRIMARSLKSGSSGFGAHALIVTPLRERVLELASRAGIRLGQIFVIPTDESKMANAFATSSNNVLLCEYLLRQMNKREVDGVVAHEISHLRLHHPRIKRFTTYGSLILPVAISIMLPFMSSAMMLMTHRTMFLSAYLLLQNRTDLLYAAAVAISVLLTLVLSRRFEYSADALAVTITRDPEAMITALVKLARLNLLPMNWSRFDENLLTHPSTMRRVNAIASRYGVPQDRLQMLIDNPDTGQEYYPLTDTAPAPLAAPAHSAPWQPPVPGQPRAQQVPPIRKKSKIFILIPIQFALLSVLLCFTLTMHGSAAAAFLHSYGIPIPLAIALTGLLGLIVTSRWVKSKILGTMPRKLAFLPTNPDRYPGLDLATLARYTDEFKALGFDLATDYTVEHDKNKFQAFGRLFINPSRRCFAEVNQIMAGQISVTPVKCSILSYIDGGWSLSIGNGEASGVMWANRLPKKLASSRPGFGPGQLLQEHLSQRSYITNQLGANLSGDMSVQSYLKRQGENALERRARVKRMSGLTYLLEIDLFNLKPKTDWLGRFAKYQPKMDNSRELELRGSESSTFAPRG